MHRVVIGPLGDDLELLPIRIVVHLELAAAQLARLEGYPLDQSADLVLIGVERDVGVGEVPNREGLTVVTRCLLVAHRAYLSDTPGIDPLEGCLLVVLNDAEVHILLDVRRPVGQLQTCMAVVVGVDVARRAHREEPREELHTVGRRARNAAQQPVAVRQRDGLAELAARDVERHAVEPPLGPGCPRELGEGVGSVFARVVDVDVLRDDHLADLPVGRPHPAVQVRHDQRRVFPGRRRQDQHRVVSVVRIDHQRLGSQSLDTGQSDRIGPLPAGVHRRDVAFGHPVAPSQELRIVVDFERDACKCGEGERQSALFLNAERLGIAALGSDGQLEPSVFRIDIEFHSQGV